MTFTSAHPALGRALATRGYSVPTAVQLAVLEADKAGRDLLVSAQTGSGKTVAFGLAIAPTLLGAAEQLPPAVEPMALIIAPTRELAMQVQRELDWLYKDTGARVVTCVGGMDVRAEARQLERGAHIVVGTPGRLRDHLERHRLNLSKLVAVVLDEADEMLDLGFREDLEFILDATPEGRQTLLFSATMPREIEAMARRYQRDAARIETLRRNEQHADIEYRAIRVAPNDIEHAVVNVMRLHEARATLVFCATRESVKRLHMRLVERGFSAVALSGELTQAERTHALQALRDGRARVLVATDVAARGLDLPELGLVIHADLPNDAETLVHRSGRTGRAGNKGLSTIVVPFNRRRKADALLAAAKLKVTWDAAPTAEEIRARDQERFIANAIFTGPASEDDAKLVDALKAGRSSDEIALALVRMHRAQLPAPEDLAEDTGPPRREERARAAREPRERFQSRSERNFVAKDRDAGASIDDHRRRAYPVRDQGREMVWFRIDIGRERNADPRWLLPLLCRAGDVTKAQVGAIKIFDRDTRFQIDAEFADNFALAARSMKPNEGRITRIGSSMGDDAGTASAPRDARGKPSWHDRKKGKPGRQFHPKADEPRRHRKGPKPEASSNGDGSARKPASKHGHKKKHRSAPNTQA
jgi:ATP-dependent RNA helicase DeaD